MPLFGGKALPRKGWWQREQLLLCETIHWASMRGTMDASVDALAARVRLAIEIVEIREGDPTP
jgi:hypothetical protein